MEVEAALKVSVCVLTYNHEKYVRQCLQSLVDQETNFRFEIIVGDDCSTDGTTAIVKEFADRYPRIVRAFCHEKNKGASENYLFTHAQSTGEYIAYMDGDDYALPGKLQVQSEVFDSEPECNIVWHKMRIEDQSGLVRLTGNGFTKEMKFYRKDIIKYISIGSNSSLMYRRKFREFQKPKFPVVDYFANVELVGDGYARILDDKFYGVYRCGVGTSVDGIKTRIILKDCFYFFAKKYPQYTGEVNSAALICFLADLKNLRKSWPMFYLVWLRTFRFHSLIQFRRHLKLARPIEKI